MRSTLAKPKKVIDGCETLCHYSTAYSHELPAFQIFPKELRGEGCEDGGGRGGGEDVWGKKRDSTLIHHKQPY